MALRERLAGNVRRLRALRGWSQESLGEHADLSQVYVSKIENALVATSVDAVAHLARALDMDPATLLEPHDS
ncbi:helix-turn-helix transcriptional regulator [bacterium]|nr:helix-turn-helix transcriptional regulator [bacterium]